MLWCTAPCALAVSFDLRLTRPVADSTNSFVSPTANSSSLPSHHHSISLASLCTSHRSSTSICFSSSTASLFTSSIQHLHHQHYIAHQNFSAITAGTALLFSFLTEHNHRCFHYIALWRHDTLITSISLLFSTSANITAGTEALITFLTDDHHRYLHRIALRQYHTRTTIIALLFGASAHYQHC
jgi:hypothetical protein